MTSSPLIPSKVMPGTRTSHVRITDQLECRSASYNYTSGVNYYSYVARAEVDCKSRARFPRLGFLSTARVPRLLGLEYVNNAGYGIERYSKPADEMRCVCPWVRSQSPVIKYIPYSVSREYKIWNPVFGPMMQCGENVSSLTAHHGQCEYKEIISHQ
jgi:hypothetical protein